ncbi:MAG TPA: alpha/beta hydrolase, partial [Candidatus Elarobacter sp.]|nr:alpha/beta hydrolase [Candidatus Elarobacter sp.]
RDAFWMQGMLASLDACHDCIKAFSETDQTEDLKKFDVPALVIQGDDDQIVPITAAAMRQVQLIPNAELKVYEGAPHGLPTTHKDRLNADLLQFFTANVRALSHAT